MEPREGADKLWDESIVGDVVAVFEVMQRLVGDRSWDPGLDGITISYGDGGTGVAYGQCTVDVNADSKASRDAIKAGVKKIGDGNWGCKDISDTKAVCSNPPQK